MDIERQCKNGSCFDNFSVLDKQATLLVLLNK